MKILFWHNYTQNLYTWSDGIQDNIPTHLWFYVKHYGVKYLQNKPIGFLFYDQEFGDSFMLLDDTKAEFG
jgi:hypothetical protein